MNHKLVIIMLFLLTVCFTSTALAMEGDDNPIDKAFATDINGAVNTVEMNYVAGKYMQAWKAEMDNVAAAIKKEYSYDEDKAGIDNYTTAYEKVADAAGQVEWLNWSNLNENPKYRSFGTGAASASLFAKAQIYKQATFNLLNTYQGRSGSEPEKCSYTFTYSGKGAELTRLRENQ
ncbi:hypothetical protein [Pelosinus sp. UFO1]|uniref:hypothetical protein n=1 Tax=Pelosinus sp. UFO1 TaxID=484770 RepID=UPI000ACC98AE|nr:hypothetical protein [Pelosinus sp. UFO1]